MKNKNGATRHHTTSALLWRHGLACLAALIAFVPATARMCGLPLAARIPTGQALITFASAHDQGLIASSAPFEHLPQASRPELRAEQATLYQAKMRSSLPQPASLIGGLAIGQPDMRFQLTPTATADTPTPASAPIGRSMAGPIVGVVLTFLASIVALGFAFGLRKRINAIAGPDPDDRDD